jgi:hypothetical protein
VDPNASKPVNAWVGPAKDAFCSAIKNPGVLPAEHAAVLRSAAANVEPKLTAILQEIAKRWGCCSLDNC